MGRLEITLFGMPSVRYEGETIFFPYNKINAMIYYIAVKEVITREEIASLLWPEEEERIAKKNLRNAIYQAKKTLGVDFIASPKKSLLTLDSSLDLLCDARLFAADPAHHLALYEGEFLAGFYVKDSEQYDYWATKMRSFYQEKYIATAYQQLSEDIDAGRYEHVEKSLRTLIDMDEYDERNTRLLMRFYAKTGRMGKVIETYYNLKKLLREELGVSPDVKTQEIYDQVLSELETGAHESRTVESFFYGRYEELAQVRCNMLRINQPDHHSILIEGEAGIGKSALVRRALEDLPRTIRLVRVACYQAEMHFTLRPIEVLLEKLEELLEGMGKVLPKDWASLMGGEHPRTEKVPDYMTAQDPKREASIERLSKLVCSAMAEIAQEAPLLLVIEDLQWMDALSVRVLTSTLLHAPLGTMLLMTTRLIFRPDLDDMVGMAMKYDKLARMKLLRFNRQQSGEFIQEATERPVKEAMLDTIYQETEGNPFFLSEYAQVLTTSGAQKLMTQKIKDTMKARFAYLSKQERDLLNLISYFYDEALLSTLTELTASSDIAIIGLLENLEQANILVEKDHDQDIGISFTHVKLREYIYMEQAKSKRQMIHQRIGRILEKNLDREKSRYIYSKLIYHYTAANIPLKAIEYELEALNYYLNFSHELFPILTIRDEEDKRRVYISRERATASFDRIEAMFGELGSDNAPEIQRLAMKFYYIKGRYLIHDGVYREGVSDIHSVIDLAKQLDEKDYILEAYKQLIYYHIQINQPEEMDRYIEEALNLAVLCNYHKEIGILLRLKGLYHLMVGHYAEAESLLNESIRTFQITRQVEDRYAVNIAAAHNYIGEIRFQHGAYEEALTEFDTAIQLTQDKNALSSLSVFYINKGKALYAMGKRSEAKEVFTLAYQLYGQFDSFWKRSVLDAYMALCSLEEEDYQAAATALAHAIRIQRHMEDPRADGTVDFVCYQIKKNIPPALQDTYFKDLVSETAAVYRAGALRLLDAYRDQYELAALAQEE